MPRRPALCNVFVLACAAVAAAVFVTAANTNSFVEPHDQRTGVMR